MLEINFSGGSYRTVDDEEARMRDLGTDTAGALGKPVSNLSIIFLSPFEITGHRVVPRKRNGLGVESSESPCRNSIFARHEPMASV